MGEQKYETTANWREQCDYCKSLRVDDHWEGIKLKEITPFVSAVCPKCGTKHAWGDQDANWFGL